MRRDCHTSSNTITTSFALSVCLLVCLFSCSEGLRLCDTAKEVNEEKSDGVPSSVYVVSGEPNVKKLIDTLQTAVEDYAKKVDRA